MNKEAQGIQMSIKVNSNTDYISAIAKPQDSELIKSHYRCTRIQTLPNEIGLKES